MGQFGMQMPGGRVKRTASMNVYTGLLFLAVVALAVASGFMWRSASMLGGNGNPFEMQQTGRVNIAAAR